MDELNRSALKFRRLGTMLDVSRNAVMNVKSVKKWIDLTSDLGYNTLMLYTEDTFEVDGNPYFGYMRGRYSKDELKDIDAYARERGVELIPCTQMLAHQYRLMRWPAYGALSDIDDIFLVGDERVYKLIEDMFRTMAECFTSRIINVGMDEADMLGRGRYYDEHGAEDRLEIFLKHLRRVSEIARKYGFEIIMWGDMFFRFASGGEYYVHDAGIDASVAERIPDNVTLIYWDYYSQDTDHYDRMLAAHKKLDPHVWFAGGIYGWAGFAPHNSFTFGSSSAAMDACLKHGVEDVFFTMWGDNGGECSRFAMLPALFFVSERAKGNNDMALIKRRFEEKFGLPFDQFMLLDLPGTYEGQYERVADPDKYLLYNDAFTGLLDSTLRGGEDERYLFCAEKLEPLRNDPRWGYLFDTCWALSKVLSLKAELGPKTRAAYAGRDMAALRALVERYRALEAALEVFYASFSRQWLGENKPHGFDAQDIRLGGLMRRTRHQRERLEALIRGEIDVIEELEEKQLDYRGGGEHFARQPLDHNSWRLVASVNII